MSSLFMLCTKKVHDFYFSIHFSRRSETIFLFIVKTAFPNTISAFSSARSRDFSTKGTASLDKSAVYDMLNRYEISQEK